MLIDYVLGQTSVTVRVKIRDSSVTTGAGLTGLTSASSGLIISTIADNEATATAYTVAGSLIDTITTLGTYAAPTAGHCRFKEVDATNHKGIYEIQLENSRLAVTGAKSLLISIAGATNAAQCDALIPLRTVNPYNANFGLTNLDAAITTRLATASYTAPLDAPGVRTAVGLATANLDTQLSTIAGYIDTEVGTLQTTATAIKAKTDNLPASFPANFATMVIGTDGTVTLPNGVDLSVGTVSASPSPTTTTFTATGTKLNTSSGGYNSAPMAIYWTSGANARMKFAISGHSQSGGNHAFTVGTMPNAPSAGDTFIIP